MKRLLLLPRPTTVAEDAIVVATSAKETRTRRSLLGLLSKTVATDPRVARIASLEMTPLARFSRDHSSVVLQWILTTSAEKCLAATTLMPEEVSTVEEEEAEPSSKRELHTTEAMLLRIKLATAIGTCLITEEIGISTSPSMTGKETADLLVTESSMTNSPGQATTPLPEDQSDLPPVLL